MPFVWSRRFRQVPQPVYEAVPKVTIPEIIPEITIPEFIAEEQQQEETE